MEFFHKATNFPFMGTRKIWYALSAVLVIISFVSFATKGLNLAIDFTGGVLVEVSFPSEADLVAIRGELSAAGIEQAQVQTVGALTDVLIRLPPVEGSTDGVLVRQLCSRQVRGALRLHRRVVTGAGA